MFWFMLTLFLVFIIAQLDKFTKGDFNCEGKRSELVHVQLTKSIEYINRL